ncbi:MAG: aminomethyltransferase family protein [Caldilineaceae bacterium]|nr:aminomethyltransferase family protein [Caldilineaceae bacterium]
MSERRSPLYDYHLRHAGRLVKGGGEYLFPDSYTSPREEHINVRTNAGMQDLSSMGQVDIKGPGAERLLNRLLVNEIRTMEPGQLRYSTMCNEDGGIVDDVTLYKFHDEHFMVVTSSGPRAQSFHWIREHARLAAAYVTDVSRGIALPVVQGPRSRALLESVLDEGDLQALRFFRFTAARINEIEVILSRSGYTGELGYELYAPADEAVTLWEHLLDRGQEFGIRPYGATAMNSLRVEKAFPLYGKDIHPDVTPFHVGLDRWIRFDKREFTGRDALLQVQEMGIDQRWTGLMLESKTPVNADDPVYAVADMLSFRARRFSGPEAGEEEDAAVLGEEIGRVTVSVRGYSVNKTLAMAYLRTTHTWPGAKVLVASAGRPILATVTATPFFDASGARIRAKYDDPPDRRP